MQNTLYLTSRHKENFILTRSLATCLGAPSSAGFECNSLEFDWISVTPLTSWKIPIVFCYSIRFVCAGGRGWGVQAQLYCLQKNWRTWPHPLGLANTRSMVGRLFRSANPLYYHTFLVPPPHNPIFNKRGVTWLQVCRIPPRHWILKFYSGYIF